MTVNATPENRQLALAPLDENVDHVRGSPAGRLIIEYGDYECPTVSCTAAATTRLPCWPRWADEPPEEMVGQRGRARSHC